MKSLFYFLIISTTCFTLCQPTQLDVNFLFKNSKGYVNLRTIEVKSVLSTDENGIAKLECDENENFVLNFNVQEQNDNEVKIETEIFDGTILVAKPTMFVPYNQRGVLEIGKANSPELESSDFSLSIIPSKEESEKIS